MADIGLIESELGGLPADLKRALMASFRYVLGNLSFGAISDERTRATNFQAYYVSGTTPAVAQTEFSLAHNLGTTPNVLFPVAALNQVGAQIVPLTIARAADAKRIYLKSSASSAPITVMVG